MRPFLGERRVVYMENIQKYEVMRMIERDGRCHISLDCVEGTLLIYRVQRGDVLDKYLVLDWFRQLVSQLELFYRSGSSRSYRYLNPYSVLVTREEKILLLDLEAKSNEFVIRNMQMRAMRNHFVKPLLQAREDTKWTADLFALGKTMQFTLACTELHPGFTPLEEYRLAKIIQKCVDSDAQKRYQNLRQILKDLPKEKAARPLPQLDKKIALSLLALVVVLVGAIRMFTMENETAKANASDLSEPDQQEQSADGVQNAEADFGTKAEDTGNGSDEKGEVSERGGEMEALRQAFEENTAEGNEKVIAEGERLKAEVLHYLAAAYERQGETEAAISAYASLCESQCETAMLEDAFYRKADLEREKQDLETAKATCQTGLERLPESELLKGILEELEKTIGASGENTESPEV